MKLHLFMEEITILLPEDYKKRQHISKVIYLLIKKTSNLLKPFDEKT